MAYPAVRISLFLFLRKKKNKGSDSLAVDVAMLIFAPIVVVALPFIFFSDSKKRKSKKMTSNEQKVFDKMNELFESIPGCKHIDFQFSLNDPIEVVVKSMKGS